MGYLVIITDIDNEALSVLNKNGFNTVYLDISNRQSIRKAFEIVGNIVDGIDGLVNNAGIFNQLPLIEAPDSDVDKLINTNVLGMYHMVKTFFPLVYKRKGRIINISSETAKALLPFQTYGLSKLMMESISNMLRLELHALGIKVSLIRPGGHATSLMDKTLKVLNQIPDKSYYRNELMHIKKEGAERILKVKNDPEDVAKVVFRALTDSSPRRIYNVNVSMLYKILSFMPSNLREYLVLRALKK